MAALRKSRGFTLVELLVVITIIGMLVSLLLPAIQSAREAGRRTTCLNNMRQAAIGLTTIEETKRGFPGYVNGITKPIDNTPTTIRVSWVVPILPALEQNPLYQNWINPTLNIDWVPASATNNRGQYVTQLPILICASNANPDLPDDALSWVINTGVALTASDNGGPSLDWPEDSASGVAFNQAQLDDAFRSPNPPQPIRKVNMDYITSNDGSTNTLLLSESLQAGRWATDPVSFTLPFQSDFAARQNVGMVWFLTGNQENANFPKPLPLAGTNYNEDAIGINDWGQAVSGVPTDLYDPMNVTQPTGLAYARPSSYHPGGVNAMFCGMNSRFLSEDIEYQVYTQLMTTFQSQVVVSYDASAPSGTPIRAGTKISPMDTPQNPASSPGQNSILIPWGYILDDADL